MQDPHQIGEIGLLMPFEEVFLQTKGTKDEVDVLLIVVVDGIERVIASRSEWFGGVDNAQILGSAGSSAAAMTAFSKSLSPFPFRMIIGILRPLWSRLRSCRMMFINVVLLPAPVPPTRTPCFIRMASGQNHGSSWTLYPSSVALRRLEPSFRKRSSFQLSTTSGGYGQFSSRFRLRPMTCVRASSAPNTDRDVENDLQVLRVLHVQPRHRDKPEKGHDCEQSQNEDANGILRTGLTPLRRIALVHTPPPREK